MILKRAKLTNNLEGKVMTVRYELVETAISMEGCCGQENVYGIAAYDEDGNRIFTCADLSFDKERTCELVRRCNSLKLSSVHIRDVVEDFVCDCDKV